MALMWALCGKGGAKRAHGGRQLGHDGNLGEDFKALHHLVSKSVASHD
jgi:hypothetical protein